MNEELRKKIAFKTQMKEYLKELSEISGRTVEQRELFSVEETDLLKSQLAKFNDTEKVSFELTPADLTSERFKRFISSLEKVNSSPVFIWIEKTNDCGALKLPSLSNVSFDFEFKQLPDGVILFLTDDLRNSLLIDFDDESLVVEVQGDDWLDVSYENG